MNHPRNWRVAAVATASAAAMVVLAFAGPGASAAAPGTITEYPTLGGGEPEGMVLGPDGNLWFTRGDDGRIGKITSAGAITTFILPSVGTGDGTNIGLHEITVGPDGNLWFTEQDNPHVQGIGKITTAGVATEYPLPNAGEPFGIAAGADGKIWYTDGNSPHQVSHIDTNGTNIVDIPIAGTAKQIINGPDHKLWFAEDNNGKIGRIDPTVGASSLVEFQAVPSASDSLYGLTVGPDGKIWFTSGTENAVGNITLDGLTVQTFTIPTLGAEPEGLVAGPDGNLWFAESDQDTLARVTTAGVFTEFPVTPSPSASPRPVSPSPGNTFDSRDLHQLAVGADGNIWWTEGGVSCPNECSIDVAGAIGTFALARPASPSPVGSQAPASVALPKAGEATGGQPPLGWVAALVAVALVAPLVTMVAQRLRRRA